MIFQKTKIALVGEDWDMVDLIDHLPDLEIIGFFAPSVSNLGPFLYLGSDEDWAAAKQAQADLKVALAIDVPKIRAYLLAHYGLESVLSLQSPFAYVSSRAILSPACIIQRGVTIMPNVQVGVACKIHTNATIHHDSKIGNFCTLAPGAQILGNVQIEDEVYIGAGAIIKQRCRVGRGAIVGAGAVVVRDVAPNTTVLGIPAKPKFSTKSG